MDNTKQNLAIARLNDITNDVLYSTERRPTAVFIQLEQNCPRKESV